MGRCVGEVGGSHSTHETCVFLRKTIQNSNSNCRPSAAARQLTFASQGQESGATPGSRVVRRTRDLCVKSGPACGGCRGCAHLGRNWRTKRPFLKSSSGARVRASSWRTVELKIRAVCASRCRQCRGCMWVGRSGGATGIYNHVRPRTASAGAPSKHDSGQGRGGMSVAFPDSNPRALRHESTPGSRRPDSTSPSTARVFMRHVRMSTHATSPSACPCVACALISAHIHIQRQPTPAESIAA